jgi:putative ABC transport system permease protein
MFKLLRTAIRFMVYDKPKSIGALAGIIISSFLIGQQVGIFIFLTNAMASLVQNNNQYIWVVDETTTNVNALSPLDMRIGRELESIPGVAKVHPLVIAAGSARFENGKSSGMVLIGAQYPDFAGGPWNVTDGKKEDLLQEGAIFTDFFDRKALGGAEIGDYFEVNGQKVFIAGNTRGVRSFSGVYSFTTIERARSLGNVPNTRASAFLIDWDPAYTQDTVIKMINANIKGIRAWGGDQFRAESVATVLGSSGIALSFGTLVIFALISGLVIIGLTLYSAAIDRIRDYGTLKAIGATNGYIRGLILTQATLFAIIGFIISTFLVEGFRSGVASAGTIFNFPPVVRLSFFLITFFISIGGSLFAIRRITRLEPAQVFRG